MAKRLIKLLADNRQAPARRPLEVVVRAEDDVAEVFLYDAIVSDELEAEWWGGIAPQSFVKELRGITAGTILLRINSPGGSVFAARAIETALREHKAKVIAHIDGLAASAATFIAMAADEIVMAPGAMFMVHKAWTLAMGNSKDLADASALLEKLDGTLIDTYVARTGQTPEQIAEWMAAETWFTAQEAVDAGFADSVSEQKEKKAAKASVWNLSAYQHAPKVDAPEPVSDPIEKPIVDQVVYATNEHRERQAQRLRIARATSQ